MIVRVFLTILSHTCHQILAHLEVLVQEYFRLHHLQRVVGNSLQGLDFVLLHVVLLQGDGIDGLEGFLEQQLVRIQRWVFHRHTLRKSQGYALVQASCGYLHQQRFYTILVRQLKIVPQSGVDDEELRHLVT